MEKEFQFDDWQKIIINWLAQLENQSQFPKWKFLLQELNIHQKCKSSLKDDLRIWYQSYSGSNKKFPPEPVDLPKQLSILPEKTRSKIKTKSVFDVNQNRVQIILPANLKKDLSFEKAKQEILNCVKEQNINVLITNWTDLSHKLQYTYHYSLRSREPVKKWYNQYRKKCISKLEKENKAENGFDIQNNSIKSTEVLIDNSNKTNLGNQLILILNQMKNQLVNNTIYTDSKLTQYYEAFFQQFTPEMLLQNCTINHGSQGLEIINGFHHVSNLNAFKDYLDSIPGLYPKLVLWAIQHPFPIKDLAIHHHAMPKFLKNYGFNLKKEIEKPYNLVSVSRIVHYFMHLIRLNEYAQPEDRDAVQFMLSNQASNSFISWGSNSLRNIAQIMYNSLNNVLLQNYPEYEKNVSHKKKEQIRELANQSMAWKTKQALTTITIWRHIQDETFEYTNYPQNINNCSLHDFTYNFIQSYTNYQKINKKQLFFEKKNIRWVREQFGKYFRGLITNAYGFYIVNPLEFIKPIN